MVCTVAPCSNAASPRPCTARARLRLCSTASRPSLPRHNMPAPPPLHAVLTSREMTAPCRSTTRPPLKLACLFRTFELQHCSKMPLASRQPACRPPRRCPTSRIHSIAAAQVPSTAITASWPDHHCCRQARATRARPRPSTAFPCL
jgi:hypothetical protein